jgi:hypothetical protein
MAAGQPQPLTVLDKLVQILRVIIWIYKSKHGILANLPRMTGKKSWVAFTLPIYC